jgi:acyl carrier protein
VKSVHEILKGIRPEFDFAGSQDFIEDGMLDSFDMMMLVSELDKNFAISIEGADITPENFKNLQTIESLLGKNGAKL